MTAKNKIRLAAAAVVLIAGALLPIFVHRTRVAQEALAAALAKQALLEAKMQKAAQDVADAERKNRAMQAAVERARSGQTAAAADKKGSTDAMGGSIGEFMKDPKLQAQYLAARRKNLLARYGPIFKSLGLQPQQIAQVENLIMDREEQRMDILNTVPGFASNVSYEGDPLEMNPLIIVAHQPAPGAVLSPDEQAAAQLLKQQDQAFQTAATDLLGPQGYQQMQQYERTLPARDIVGDLTGTLTPTPNPLSPDQANQLTQILAEASPSYRQGDAADDLGHGNWSAQINWDQALGQAKQVLSQSQLGALNQVIGPMRTAQQFDSILRAAASGGGPSGGGAARPAE